eukprot:3166233-Prymnesium_polylepis.1
MFALATRVLGDLDADESVLIELKDSLRRYDVVDESLAPLRVCVPDVLRVELLAQPYDIAWPKPA